MKDCGRSLPMLSKKGFEKLFFLETWRCWVAARLAGTKTRDESLTYYLPNTCKLSMMGNFCMGRNAFPKGIAQVLHGPGLQQRLGSP